MNDEMLHAYLDGELSPPERAQFEEALAADAVLAAKYEQLCALHESLDLLPSVESSLDAVALLRSERRRRIGRVFRLAAPLAAAAAALVLVLVPSAPTESTNEAVFSVEEQVRYVYWETDDETFGSGDLNALEGEILAALEPS
ncbi:MAG: anti-sigma factor family protein [Planctomycetota bacterium]|jgi:anti-sigma factor RsiW